MLGFPTLSDPLADVYTIDLNSIDPVQVARRLQKVSIQRRPQFLISCQHLACLRTLGVSYLVSQLLLTRKAGADVLLYDVDPVLNRALRLLGLHQLFRVLPSLPAS